MYAAPTDLDERPVLNALRSRWDIDVSSVSYEPVGFGTHHYLARDGHGGAWFANVDDLTRDGLPPEAGLEAFARAFATARALADAGLEFVAAPLASRDGAVIVRIDERYALSVVPFIEGSSNEFGEFPSDEERRLVLGALGRMHSTAVPQDVSRRETFEIPLRAELFEALDDLSSEWHGGPYGEPCRALLGGRAESVRTRFHHFDKLAAGVPRDGWVVTHGEPHAANVMRRPDGAVVLIDWDTAALGPRERDLWMVEPRSEPDVEAYVSAGGMAVLNETTIHLYRLMWDLMEIAVYTHTFRRQHVEDANTIVAWKGLLEYLSSAGPAG